MTVHIDLGPITPGMVPVTVYVLWDRDAQCYLRETANGAGTVTNDREWVPAADVFTGTEYRSLAGAQWAAERTMRDAVVTPLTRWVEND